MNYIELPKDSTEIIQVGFQYQGDSCGATWQNASLSDIGLRAGDQSVAGHWRKPVASHNWVKFSERKPTKEDTANSAGCVLVRIAFGEADSHSVYFTPWDAAPDKATHWMPLNFIPESPAPIKIEGKEILPMKDGSVKISCGTVVPAKDIEEFLRQREEIMK